MPRTARLDVPDLLQHVIVRGVDRCDIFRDDGDRTKFIGTLAKLLVQTETECLAWALMSNHVHLLLRPRRTRLAFFMRRLLTGYAIYFNRRHQRCGHLFQNRYKSIVCEEDAYLLELVRYIHLNPLRAGLVADLTALDVYAWSGHSVIMGNGVLAGQLADGVLAFFAPGQGEARRRYRIFVADGVTQGKRDDLTSTGRRREPLADGPYDDRILGSIDFVEELRARRELVPAISASVDIRELIDKVCDHFALTADMLRLRTRAAKVAEVRGIVCYLAVRHLGQSGVEVGRHLGLSRSGVSIAAGRGEQLLKSDPALLALLN
ncbi:MAG: transposase [Desulfuromonadales bacterium]|nr:transposase [Desulfuromonadales bacterium]